MYDFKVLIAQNPLCEKSQSLTFTLFWLFLISRFDYVSQFCCAVVIFLPSWNKPNTSSISNSTHWKVSERHQDLSEMNQKQPWTMSPAKHWKNWILFLSMGWVRILGIPSNVSSSFSSFIVPPCSRQEQTTVCEHDNDMVSPGYHWSVGTPCRFVVQLACPSVSL